MGPSSSDRADGPPPVRAVLICAEDPAQRAEARASFADPGWYVFECSFDEVEQVTRSIRLDAVVVVGRPERRFLTLIRDATSLGRFPIEHVIAVRRGEMACSAATRAMGHSPGRDQA